MQRVRVRPGWRLSPDGTRPRLGRPDATGREFPGQYLFHDIKNPGRDRHPDTGRAIGEPTEFIFVDRVEETYDTPLKRSQIQQGYLLVVDEDHELFTLNCPDPVAVEDTPTKKTTRKLRKRTASED